MWRLLLIAALLCSMSGCVSTMLYNKLRQKIGENDGPEDSVVRQTQA